MKQINVVCFLILIVGIKSSLLAQTIESPNESKVSDKSIFRIGEEVSQLSSIQINLAMSPMGAVPNYFTGSITFGLSGVLSGSYIHDNAFGTPLGKLVPTNQLELRLQILEQRQYYPAVSLIYGGMVNEKSESYSSADLNMFAPNLTKNGLRYISSNAIKSNYGAGVTSNIRNKFILSGMFGVQQLTWQQSWTDFGFDTTSGQTFSQFPLPKTT